MAQNNEVDLMKNEIESLSKELSDRRLRFDTHIGLLAMEGRASRISTQYVLILKKQHHDMIEEINELDGLYSELLQDEVNPILMADVMSGVTV